MAAITMALAMTLASCQPPAAPVISNGQAAVGGADSASYLDELSSRPTVTEAQAVEGIMLLLGKQQKTTFAEAVKVLVDQEIADPAWGFQADRPVTRGKVAYMIYQACGVKGGLTLTLAGPSRRYCLKELQYRGLMVWGLPANPVTGMEYVAILARADELRETGKVSAVMIREGG
jgi:hypothetical protein